jgi:hypothetical protein
MSDVVIVSKAAYDHQWVPEGRVPHGTVFTDEAYELHAGFTKEQLRDGAVPAVDWRGVSADLEQPKKAGRPKKV